MALLFLALVWLASGGWGVAEQIPVLERQGAEHGFLVLQDENGKDIAVGDQVSDWRGKMIRSRLTFHFEDGSIDDDTTVYRQGSVFQLLYDHHVQKGPSFNKPIDVTIDVPHSQVTWIEHSDKGDQKKQEHMTLPADLANGMIALIVENFPAKAGQMQVSYLSSESKPRIVKLVVTRDGSDKVLIGTSGRRAERFNVHVNIGGIAGMLAQVVGEQPPDFKLWVLDGNVPTFVKMEGPMFLKGPVWKINLTAPKWLAAETTK